MAEIWNLEALCRCCHADGIFKSLDEQYIVDDDSVVNYLNLLIETLGVTIKPPPANASFSICDNCISQLRSASVFKRMVLDCETKFEEYCKNELLSNIKMEPEYLYDDQSDGDAYEDMGTDDPTPAKKKRDENTNKNVTKQQQKEITIKLPKTLKHVKKEDTKQVIEISIDVKPTVEKKPAKKRIRPKEKSKQIKIKKPKEEESCVVKVKTETGEVFSCRVCGITYENLDELNVHINDEHYVGYKCAHCGEIFAKENKFKKHYAEVHLDTKPFQCPHCYRKVGSKHSLNEHINSAHTKERHYQCDVCQKIFLNKQILRIHLRKHNGTFTKLICDQCGVCCNDRSNLKTHIQTVHEKVRNYECEVCGKKFSAAKHVRIHMRSHTGERPYECDNCDKKYPTREALKAHQKVHDNSGYKCKMCELVFPTRGQHISHYRSHLHLTEKKYKCHLCEKAFAGKYSLNRHIFEHTGERPFGCVICKREFKQKHMLTRHNSRFHNPNKPPVVKEKCDICNRTVPNIEKHKLAHLNKPYACHLCEKKYPEQNALNRHLQRHSGIKPHMCDLCDRGFVQLRTLKKHKMKVHKMVMKTEQEDHYDSLVNAYTIANLKRNS